MTKTAPWPYDAIEDDPLTALRIPVTKRRPERAYIVALHGIPDMLDEIHDEPLHRPTDREAAMIAAYIDYIRQRTYNESWQHKMLAEPLDADPGHVTVVLHKYGTDDWGYRRSTWDTSWFSPPKPALSPDRLPLESVLDRASSGGAEPHRGWTAWKAARPEVFGDV